jgi:hypothetical protein
MARDRGRRSRRDELWHGYRRPVWRDRVFWFAVLVAAAGVVVQEPFRGFEASPGRWALLGVQVVVTLGVVLALVGVLAGTARGFGEGWRSAAAAVRTPERASTREPAAPAAADDEQRPALGVEVERRARALGRAIGTTRRRQG